MPVRRGARHKPGYAMLLAVCTHSLSWDHQSLRFRLTPHIQELRGPDPKQRLLLRHVCASSAWTPCPGSLTGVPSFRVPPEKGHGSLVLGSLETWAQRSPGELEETLIPLQHTDPASLGFPHSHIFSALLHIPCPKSPPACKQALEASQWLCVL